VLLLEPVAIGTVVDADAPVVFLDLLLNFALSTKEASVRNSNGSGQGEKETHLPLLEKGERRNDQVCLLVGVVGLVDECDGDGFHRLAESPARRSRGVSNVEKGRENDDVHLVTENTAKVPPLFLLLHPRATNELVRHEVDVHVRKTILLRLETDRLCSGVDRSVTLETVTLSGFLDEVVELKERRKEMRGVSAVRIGRRERKRRTSSVVTVPTCLHILSSSESPSS
jgi:hypothetical protein